MLSLKVVMLEWERLEACGGIQFLASKWNGIVTLRKGDTSDALI